MELTLYAVYNRPRNEMHGLFADPAHAWGSCELLGGEEAGWWVYKTDVTVGRLEAEPVRA